MDAGWRFHLGDPADAGYGVELRGWQWTRANNGRADVFALPLPNITEVSASWKTAAPGEDTFNGRRGFNLYRLTMPRAAGAHHTLHFDSVDDNATVYLNGHKMAHHEGWNDPFDVELDSGWNADGKNELAVLVENTAGAGGIGTTFLQTGAQVTVPGPARALFNDAQWTPIHLPHDFVVEGTFTPTANVGHGSLPAGVGWYRKTFSLAQADKGRAIWLDFDGVYRDSRVWLNGALLGRHSSGYTGFRYDISHLANYGAPNTLVVRADARRFEGWWYEGGGIYRHVWLVKTNPVHVAQGGVYVSTPTVQPAKATVAIQTTLEGISPTPDGYSVSTAVSEADGRRLATMSAHISPVGGKFNVTNATVIVGNPHLWSLDDPYLYTLVTTVTLNSKVIDSVTTHFGIRTIRFDADKGFFLNGKSVKIQGVCNHQDFAGVGIAVPDGLETYRVQKLKEMGCNAWRMSHNPPNPELLDACDRLGMLVMDENRHLGDTYQDHTPRGTRYSDLSDLADLIKRDRNHPSIIIWSMCNEEGLQGSEEGKNIFAAMMNVVHGLDTTRPISCAMNGGWGQGISTVEDLQGCNYNPRGYDAFHQSHPNMPMFGSETASAVSTRGEYANDPVAGYVSAYDVNAPSWAQPAEIAWKALGERAFMAGGFVWTGFDYKGEPTPYGWPCINSHFGIMDMCGFAKDTWWYYKAWWGDKPVVHILPHWNWRGKEGRQIDVWCHSNCDSVELFLNGASLGVKAVPKLGHVEWQVPYRPGKLEAVGTTNGVKAADDVVETTGAPAALRLVPSSHKLMADSEDVAMVTVEVVDSSGRVVPTAGNLVEFNVTGAGTVTGVGNGDPSSHEPDKASQRKAFNGKCMVVVQSTDKPGAISLEAISAGLAMARITLTTARVAENLAH